MTKEGKVSFEFSIPVHLELAKNLKGHLMLVTGDADDTVNPANTSRMVHSLILAGKDFELVVLPGQRHGVPWGWQRNIISGRCGDISSDICWMNDK